MAATLATMPAMAQSPIADLRGTGKAAANRSSRAAATRTITGSRKVRD
jgi:hypothetical protein